MEQPVLGHHERTLDRIAKFGDGWMPNAYPADQSALEIFGQLRQLTEQAGRDPAKIGIEVWVSMGSGNEAEWAKEARFWKQAGASHLCLTTTFNRRHHKRIPGHTLSDHIGALRRYHAASLLFVTDPETTYRTIQPPPPPPDPPPPP